MEQNDKTKEGQQENKRDVRKILDDALEEIREYGKRTGADVRINQRKGPVVIFNPPRHLIEQARRAKEKELQNISKQKTKKETD